MHSTKTSLVIFGDLFSFPEGNAATNRVYTYAKGFMEHGVDVHVVCFSTKYSHNHDGVSDGIKYYHTFQQKTRSSSFFVRNWKKLKKYSRSYSLLKKINRRDKIIAINSWTNLLSTHLFAWFLAKRFRARLITEGSEHPLRFHQGRAMNRLMGKLKLYIESRLCDGIFCISRYLVEFYKSHGLPDRKLLLVPSTVDPSVFDRVSEKPLCAPYIGYFGSLTFKRDNVDMLIRAFGEFHKAYPGVHLVLGGFSTPEVKRQMLEMINELDLESKATILDYLSRPEVVRYISNADVLVMTRSRDLESDASYPSKLTEFLATGRPVISVKVGEVSDYLEDEKNAFLVEAGDPGGLCRKLEFIYANYEFAQRVGEQGRQLTKQVFHYNYQAKRMIDFINSMTHS